LHTTRGLSHKGIYLTPPGRSKIVPINFTPDVIFNHLLQTDLKSKLEIFSVHSFEEGLFMDTNSTPTSAEMVFVLKHVRRLYPAKEGDTSTVATITPSLTSFLKIIDVPIKADLEKKVWAAETRLPCVRSLSYHRWVNYSPKTSSTFCVSCGILLTLTHALHGSTSTTP
jgi:hypothetical protein